MKNIQESDDDENQTSLSGTGNNKSELSLLNQLKEEDEDENYGGDTEFNPDLDEKQQREKNYWIHILK